MTHVMGQYISAKCAAGGLALTYIFYPAQMLSVTFVQYEK